MHWDKVDIEIWFTSGPHGDAYPFPYEGGSQLAHAFFPGGGLGGDIHFNDNVDWTRRNALLYTATHEIGHSLGLRHSSNQDAIMFSHLLSIKDEIKLHSDDIEGIQVNFLLCIFSRTILHSRIYKRNFITNYFSKSMEHGAPVSRFLNQRLGPLRPLLQSDRPLNQ
jgi:hypothetical protein